MDDAMKQLNETFSMVLEVYFSYIQIEPIDIEITITDEIANIYREKRPDLFEGDYSLQPEDIERNRGLTIPPKTIDGRFVIVIKQDYLWKSVKVQDWQWVGTFTHEITHVLDYINYAKINDLDNYDIAQRDLVHRPFVFWTEFHARATGYFFMRKFIFGEKYNDKSDRSQIDNILQKELPFQINWFSQQYEAATENADRQLYEAMQFMGRYSIWEKLFPNVFNRRTRQQVYGTNPWMLHLYEFLITHQDIESANEDFDKMLDIIRTNFGGL